MSFNPNSAVLTFAAEGASRLRRNLNPASANCNAEMIVNKAINAAVPTGIETNRELIRS